MDPISEFELKLAFLKIAGVLAAVAAVLLALL